MPEYVTYDDDLQPASACLAQQTHMPWSPIEPAMVGTDAVSLGIAAAIEEINAAVAARVAKNNALVVELNAADVATGTAAHGADGDGAGEIGAAIPR
jgi:hypothetical protein